MRPLLLVLFIVLPSIYGAGQVTHGLNNQKIDGYRGIWFALGQRYDAGDKYSGALGTYTAKHIPLALFSPEANKTFFVYGGTTGKTERHLLCMVGSYDHSTGKVSKPVVAFDKMGVEDPHDNPTISMDKDGYIWIFVSGRGSKRPGIKLKSRRPLSITHFDIVERSEFTYPQIWKTDKGFFHFFTKYTGVRELYYETWNGSTWSETRQLAGIPSGKDKKKWPLSGKWSI